MYVSNWHYKLSIHLYVSFKHFEQLAHVDLLLQEVADKFHSAACYDITGYYGLTDWAKVRDDSDFCPYDDSLLISLLHRKNFQNTQTYVMLSVVPVSLGPVSPILPFSGTFWLTSCGSVFGY